MSSITKQIVLTLTVANHPGVMTHICGLFARRAFNVEGILCLPLNDSSFSRIWLLVKDDERLPQMLSQIEKLEDVQAVVKTDDCKIFMQLAELQKI
ncbi:acetolactate synthase small subunit [Orbus sturtevantii]|uniref:acetolactate synthase small subunit n=1 Tax=Orbus sturtevantii TaxID=3074109 RepID=UPI00370D8B76